jgi:hypothetical protein
MNAGCRAVEIDDLVQGARIPLRLLYPTRASERIAPFGPFELSVPRASIARHTCRACSPRS